MQYARQGSEGLAIARSALAAGQPLSVAFIDIHMPPGIDGVETAVQLWREQRDLEIVLCTAHSTYSWQDILARVPRRDQLVILRKPFEPIEVRQLAACLSEKCRRGRELRREMMLLETQVQREVARRLQIELGLSQKFESLGRLAAGIAHEINTPTQYIQSSLEFLAESIGEIKPPDPSEAATELIDSMQAAVGDALLGVSRVSAIVRSVREYAHTSDKLHDAVDVNRQIRMAAELARSEYRNSADLMLDLAEVPTVSGHADDLGRAILNLVINAAHAIHAKRGAGRGRITITTRASGSAVTISIADTGTGIPEEHRVRIFEPFFTTKALGEGTGQGLAMVRATIVDRHHGAIDFESASGVGTTFRVTLPFAQQETAA